MKQTMPSRRKKLPAEVESDVLTQSRRRCCICFGLHRDSGVKSGQIAHLDKNPNNNSVENLAFLCQEHHDIYDSVRSQTKGFTIREVKGYRTELVEWNSRRIETGKVPRAVQDETAPPEADPDWLLERLPEWQQQVFLDLTRGDGGRFLRQPMMSLVDAGFVQCVHVVSSTEAIYRLHPNYVRAAARLWALARESRFRDIYSRQPVEMARVISLFGQPVPHVCDCDPKSLFPYADYLAIQRLERAQLLSVMKNPALPQLETYVLDPGLLPLLEADYLYKPALRDRLILDPGHVAASGAGGSGAGRSG